jgi:catechol 2,3-dioxygenase-like lactoylglutathione lyase family enzyme
MAVKGTISHVEIYVSDLQRSTEFWGWLLNYLGYELFQKWDMGISWIKAETYIVLVQVEEKYLQYKYHRCHTGLNHLAFYCDDDSEVDYLTEQLQERKANILYSDRNPYASGKDIYAVFFEDPDRIKVEVIAQNKNKKA